MARDNFPAQIYTPPKSSNWTRITVFDGLIYFYYRLSEFNSIDFISVSSTQHYVVTVVCFSSLFNLSNIYVEIAPTAVIHAFSMVDTELNRVDGFLHQYRSHCASKWVECRWYSCHSQFSSLLVLQTLVFWHNIETESVSARERVCAVLHSKIIWMILCVRTVRFRWRRFSKFEGKRGN